MTALQIISFMALLSGVGTICGKTVHAAHVFYRLSTQYATLLPATQSVVQCYPGGLMRISIQLMRSVPVVDYYYYYYYYGPPAQSL